MILDNDEYVLKHGLNNKLSRLLNAMEENYKLSDKNGYISIQVGFYSEGNEIDISKNFTVIVKLGKDFLFRAYKLIKDTTLEKHNGLTIEDIYYLGIINPAPGGRIKIYK